VFGFAAHAATRGQRDFSSVRGLAASHYDLIAREGTVERARAILGEAGLLPEDSVAGVALTAGDQPGWRSARQRDRHGGWSRWSMRSREGVLTFRWSALARCGLRDRGRGDGTTKEA
jgi:hypothetical protein